MGAHPAMAVSARAMSSANRTPSLFEDELGVVAVIGGAALVDGETFAASDVPQAVRAAAPTRTPRRTRKVVEYTHTRRPSSDDRCSSIE
jgi:hypothetical protein